MVSVALCSLSYGEEYKNIVHYGRLNKIEYCKKHNYDFIEDESFVDLSRPLQWSKIPLLKAYLSKYDYLIWVDADTYITNFDITVEKMIEKLENYDMMYEKDPFIWVNSGFMLLKNTKFCHEILETCYNITDQICHEQGSIDYLYRTNWNNSQQHIKVLEHDQGFNQYWNSWSPGDFMIHFPGCHEPGLKKEALLIMMNRFCQVKRDSETDDEYTTRKLTITKEYLQNEWNNRLSWKSLPADAYI